MTARVEFEKCKRHSSQVLVLEAVGKELAYYSNVLCDTLSIEAFVM